MKRRTLARHRARNRAETGKPGRAKRPSPPPEDAHHHHVYVVLLDPAVRAIPAVRRINPRAVEGKPCVYVGMTGLDPEERFRNHKSGVKAASVVRRFGQRLLPELFAHLNPMPYDAAAAMERDLAEDLRRAGYVVTGGH